ncbi:hypothetical protein [Streptomyces sp. NPDC018610]|uniref:hypothetical protein n=1 Tax=Streptomyces sp. NPDC018610 TaxID=3365049 RepID=UPI0037A3A99B
MPRLLPAAVLCAAALLTAAACSSGGSGRDADAAATEAGAATRPAAPVSPSAAAMLTAAQAQDALLGESDLGAPWGPTEGAATWRDGVLKARTDLTGCQRLLDALYADEPLGTPTGTRAVAAFDDGDDQAQLRYQVLSLHAADVDRSLAWLRTLPQGCAQFTASTTSAGEQEVRVGELALPKVGDARQGLRVTFTGESDDGDTTTLTLDVVVVRVGDDAIVLTDGAVGAVPPDTASRALALGVQRLADVRHQARVQA